MVQCIDMNEFEILGGNFIPLKVLISQMHSLKLYVNAISAKFPNCQNHVPVDHVNVFREYISVFKPLLKNSWGKNFHHCKFFCFVF